MTKCLVSVNLVSGRGYGKLFDNDEEAMNWYYGVAQGASDAEEGSDSVFESFKIENPTNGAMEVTIDLDKVESVDIFEVPDDYAFGDPYGNYGVLEGKTFVEAGDAKGTTGGGEGEDIVSGGEDTTEGGETT